MVTNGLGAECQRQGKSETIERLTNKLMTLVCLWDLLTVRKRPALSFKTTFNCCTLRSLILKKVHFSIGTKAQESYWLDLAFISALISQYTFWQIILPDFNLFLIFAVFYTLYTLIYICLYMYNSYICMYLYSVKMLRQVVSDPETQSPPVQSPSAEGRKLYMQTGGVCDSVFIACLSCFYLEVYY